MMHFLAMALIASGAAAAHAQGYHLNQGYERENGTYVAPHYQTNSNDNRMDNWGTRGNVNPYTGAQGTVNPYSLNNTYRH